MTTHGPFSIEGITRDAAGIARYDELPGSLLAAIRASVEAYPDNEAVVEVGGPRLTYTELWERASRLAGGLRAGGFQHGQRAAILLPAGADWVLAFLGTLLAGGVVVPVNTRFAEPEIAYVLDDCGATHVFRPGEALPDGPGYTVEGLGLADAAAMSSTTSMWWPCSLPLATIGVPKMTDAGEPGGVTCTTRKSSFTMSASSRQPNAL